MQVRECPSARLQKALGLQALQSPERPEWGVKVAPTQAELSLCHLLPQHRGPEAGKTTDHRFPHPRFLSHCKEAWSDRLSTRVGTRGLLMPVKAGT